MTAVLTSVTIIVRPYYNRDMGSIERNVQARVRKQNIRHAVLSTVAAVGIIAVAMAAPNTLQLLKYAPGMRSRYASRTKRSIERLIEQGYLSLDGRHMLRLTKSGESLMARLAVGSAKYKPPEKWDWRWRIVTFDISEKRKVARNRLRNMLKVIGFSKLQSSVWIYPYDCEDLVQLIKTDFALGREVLYIVTEDIEGDARLRRHFKLT